MFENEIIVQVIGVFLIGMTLLTPQAKSRKSMLVIILMANLLSCALFFFARASAGFLGLIVTTIRSFVYWQYASRNKKPQFFVLNLFIVLQIAATIIGWEAWFSVLTFALLLNTYGQWQTNEKILRVCLLGSAVALGIYCIFTHAYTGAVNKFIQAFSATIALHRFKKSDN